jgi:hypothetical protein
LRDYFDVNSKRAPIADWGSGPISIDGGAGWNANNGDKMRIVYSIPSGAKYIGEKKDDFKGNGNDLSLSRPQVGPVPLLEFSGAPLTSNAALPNAIIPGISYAGVGDVRSFVTFPGVSRAPLLVDDFTAGGLRVYGKTPPENTLIGGLTDGNNVIFPNLDLYLVRAAVAYVRNGTFCLIDVNDRDPSVLGYPPASDDRFSGFRVEGIRAVLFEQDPDLRWLRVHVVAEGDVADSSRKEDENIKRIMQALRAVSPDIDSNLLDSSMHYGYFTRTFRTRSLER